MEFAHKFGMRRYAKTFDYFRTLCHRHPSESLRARALSTQSRTDQKSKTQHLKLIVEYGMIHKFPRIHYLASFKLFENLSRSGNEFFKLLSSKWGSAFSNSPGQGFEPALIDVPQLSEYHKPKEVELEDKKSEGFVWGVPKHRRSVERRWSIKIGAENWLWKMEIPKYDLRICETCGHHYQAKHLCRNCYDRVKAETKELRKTIEAQLGDNVEDKDVVLLYQNEGEHVDKEQLKDKLVVEIPKERPAWFSKNLLQKTTAVPDPNTTTVTVPKQNLG